MKSRCTLAVALAVACLVPLARSGHESPVYPSYYPHEIEIAAFDSREAGTLLAAGKLHAFIGAAPPLPSPASDVLSVPSLGSFVVVRLNPASAIAGDETAACALAGTIVGGLAAKGGDAVAHPYPVTPYHGDFLHHADLAEAARTQFARSAAPASSRSYKIRGEGALAQTLVPSKWRTDGADWEATVVEVDAGRLVASSTAAVNGWLGPPWVRSGWFHAHALLADTTADTEAKQRVDADLMRLQSGEIADPAERANLERELVRRLTAGCRAVVAGYTLKREYFNNGFSAGIENIASDSLEGFNSPMFLRTVKLKDFPWNGWLRLGTATAPQAAWNPVGGFTDDFGRLIWFGIGDPAAIPSPYEQAWILTRISEVEQSPRR